MRHCHPLARSSREEYVYRTPICRRAHLPRHRRTFGFGWQLCSVPRVARSGMGRRWHRSHRVAVSVAFRFPLPPAGGKPVARRRVPGSSWRSFVVLSGSAMSLEAGAPSFAAGAGLWAAALVLISAPNVMPLAVRALGQHRSIAVRGHRGLQVFAGRGLTSLTEPLSHSSLTRCSFSPLFWLGMCGVFSQHAQWRQRKRMPPNPSLQP